MKKLTAFATATALAATMATGAVAEETIKPLTIAKSTQVPPISLGLGGLGAGASTALIIGGIVTTIIVVQATSGT